jgi:hypothetical protein
MSVQFESCKGIEMDNQLSLGKRFLLTLVALLIATSLWLPSVHLLFRPNLDDTVSEAGISPKARALAARHLALWSDPGLRAREIEKMRRNNAEWDFMARTFFVLALGNMALRNPEAKDEYLEIVDIIIDETIRLEHEHGANYFLMAYARYGQFRSRDGRSLFVDSEIALMLAVRRLVEEKAAYRPLLTERVEAMVATMQENPVLSGESYPDEAWMFCNTTALAAIRIADVLDGTDHSDFINRWLEVAKRELVDPKTGLLISSFTFDGRPKDGPEGSSIWMVAHNLLLVDRAFAEDQYRRARAELGGNVLGFGYAREWPGSWVGPMDVDSGPIVPVLEISAGSSGMALVGASAFGDRAYLAALLTSLNFGGFPIEEDGQLRYAASNQVGDAVMLYAMVLGPVWEEAEIRGGEL